MRISPCCSAPLRAFAPRRLACQAPILAPAGPWGALANEQRSDGLLLAYLALAGAPPRPGESELSRGQSFDGGSSSVQVDGQGNIGVNTRGSAVAAALVGENGLACLAGRVGGQSLRLENGAIQLPNGKRIPFGNTGAIVVLPDGSQICAGRSSSQSSEQIRAAYAGPGEKIPTSPPGATNVFYLNAAGDVVRQEVQ